MKHTRTSRTRGRRQAPAIVVIGGGTGLSTLLRGLKHYTDQLTAIVTVTDDGGSSGALRREMGVLPPGDIRNCLVALSEEETLMSRLFQYRFPAAGSLSGHSFGNLFLTAMAALSDGFDAGITHAGEVLAIRGRVLPVTLSSVTLKATMKDGRVVQGESKIARALSEIRTLSIHPSPPPATREALRAIAEADAIVLGPGSLYTSIIANLLVREIVPALKKARAPKLYVANIMTQPGETAGYTLSDHVRSIERHACPGLIDAVIVNDQPIPRAVARRYAAQGAYPVVIDREQCGTTTVVTGNLMSTAEYARHDSGKLARLVVRVIAARRAGAGPHA